MVNEIKIQKYDFNLKKRKKNHSMPTPAEAVRRMFVYDILIILT